MFQFMLKLSARSLWFYRRRTAGLIAVIFLGNLLLLETFFVYRSYCEMRLEDARENSGQYHVHIRRLDEDRQKRIERYEGIRQMGYLSQEENVRISEPAGGEDEGISSYVFQEIDSEAMALAHLPLLWGEFPQGGNEVMVSANMKKDGSYLYRSLMKGKGQEISVQNGTDKHTYRVVGVLDDLDAGDREQVCHIYACRTQISQPGEVYLCVADSRYATLQKWLTGLGYQYAEEVFDSQYMKKHHIDYQGDYPVELNNHLLALLHGSGQDQGMARAKRLVVVVACFAALLEIMMISSLISVSLQQRKQETGMLRTCGFSPGMIVTCYVWELLLVLAVGLSLSCICSMLGNQYIVSLARRARLSDLSRLKIRFEMSGVVFSCLLSGMSASVSFLLPVIISGRQSVMQQMKGRGDVSFRRDSKHDRHFGAAQEWLLGIRQVFSHKGRTCSVVCSIIAVYLLVISYVICFQVIREEQEAQTEHYRGQFSLLGDSSVDIHEVLGKIPYKEWSDYLYDTIQPYDAEGMAVNAELAQEEYSYWNDGGQMNVETCSMSKDFYERHFLSGDGMLPEYKTLEKEGAGILCDTRQVEREGKEVSLHVFDMSFPSTWHFQDGGKMADIRVIGRGELDDGDYPAGATMPALFLPEKVYLSRFQPQYTVAYLNVQAARIQDVKEWFVAHQEELDVTVGDYATEYMAARDTRAMLSKLLFAALVMFAVIVGANIVNTFWMDMIVQKREMSILRALGMSRFRQILIVSAEGLAYTISASVLAVLVILCVMQKLLYGLVQIRLTSMTYCWVLLAAASGAVFLFCLVVGCLVLMMTQKQSLVAILGKEE